jgi:hypothetical protein
MQDVGNMTIPQNRLVDHVAALDTAHCQGCCSAFSYVQIHAVVFDKESPTASAL